MIALPAIQSATTVKAVACNAGLGTSPVVSANYTFKLAFAPNAPFANPPTYGPISAWDVGGNQLTANDDGVITVDASDVIYIDGSASDFTDEAVVYTTDGVTIPNCTGTGTSVSGQTATIPITARPGKTFNLNAILCGAGQQSSGLTTAQTFHVVVAQPQIVDTVGSTVVDATTYAIDPTGANTGTATGQGAVSAQNVVNAAITSPTANWYVCYITGATPPVAGTGGMPLPV